MYTRVRQLLFWIFCLLLVGCGGGGGSGSSGPKPPTWTVGVFPAASTFEAKCANPRTGTDPATGHAYPDVLATRTDENMWLRSWTNDLYLWFDEVPDTNPSPYTTADYFDLLKTSARTASGNPKDKFHFTLATSDWIALSQSGAEAGYGAQWVILSSTPPRRVVVAFTDPGTPAAPTGMSALVSRGTEVTAVDGVDVANGSDVNTLNNGLFPTAAGEVHTFTVQDPGSSTRTITMTSAIVTTTPVQNVSVIAAPSGPVGYMLFNDHIATAENLLIAAINTMRNAAVTDLVLDIRYNGGGFLDLASELAFMIAGPGQTTGKTFEQLQFNAKHPTRDPVTGNLITPIPFHSSTVGLGGPAGQMLPSLDLTRVFVLTGSGTCSASESIINSLRGINVQVIQIGSTTCGKPYGFYPQDNCGTTYFSIEFKGINEKAFGDYTDGFSPQNTPSSSSPGELIPGCSVADDFSHALGDQAEERLKVALDYRQNPVCSVSPSGIGPHALAVKLPVSDGELVKSPWRENRILRR